MRHKRASGRFVSLPAASEPTFAFSVGLSLKLRWCSTQFGKHTEIEWCGPRLSADAGMACADVWQRDAVCWLTNVTQLPGRACLNSVHWCTEGTVADRKGRPEQLRSLHCFLVSLHTHRALALTASAITFLVTAFMLFPKSKVSGLIALGFGESPDSLLLLPTLAAVHRCSAAADACSCTGVQRADARH